MHVIAPTEKGQGSIRLPTDYFLVISTIIFEVIPKTYKNGRILEIKRLTLTDASWLLNNFLTE